MLCDDDLAPPTDAPRTPSTAQPAVAAAPEPKKKKKKKKKKFSELMADATQGSSPTPEAAEAEHRQKIARHLGGGTFSKLDKI
jgi:hypothetical protein